MVSNRARAAAIFSFYPEAKMIGKGAAPSAMDCWTSKMSMVAMPPAGKGLWQ